MPIHVSTSKAMPVPLADSSEEEISAVPEEFELENTEMTVPMATNHLKYITLFFKATGAGDAEIYSRADRSNDWYLLDTQSFAVDGCASLRLNCPCGQLRVVNNGLTTLEVRAQGIAQIQR